MTTEHYLTVTELRAKLKVSRATLYRLMAQGLPSVKLRHARRFLWRAVEAFVQKALLEPGDYRCGVCQWAGNLS